MTPHPTNFEAIIYAFIAGGAIIGLFVLTLKIMFGGDDNGR